MSDDVSTFRLYLLRAAYLLVSAGLAVFILPTLFSRGPDLQHMHGVALSLFAAVAFMAALGLRYPLQMLPILLFELTWKSVWMLVIALPHWLQGTMAPAIEGTVMDNLVGLVLFPIAIPWGYVWRRYVMTRGDRWLAARAAA